MSTDNKHKTNTMELVTPYFLSSVERTAELQKKCLDVAAGQFREWIALNKQMASFVPSPMSFLFDVAERTFEKGMEAQKKMIDVAVEQTHTVVRLSSERQPDFTKVAEEMTSMVRKSVEQATAVQKNFTEFAAEETRKVSDVAIQQFGLAGTPVASAVNTFKKNVSAMVDMQNSMVDIATKPLKAKAAKAK